LEAEHRDSLAGGQANYLTWSLSGCPDVAGWVGKGRRDEVGFEFGKICFS
jgi:hypothetical protein